MEISREINKNFNDERYGCIIEQLQQHSVNQLLESLSEAAFLLKSLVFIFKKSISFCQTDELSAERRRILDDLIYECARLLRNSCAIGRDVIQNHILNVFDVSELFEAIRAILESKAFSPSKKTLKMCWQFVANLAVQNVDGSHHFWRYCGGFVCGPNRHWQCPCESGNAREITMILYNAFRGGNGNCKVFIEFLLGCYDSSSIIQHETNNEFHQIFMEYFITKYPLIVSIGYLKLDISKQLHLLYYIADYMRAPSHATISNYLLEGICFQFKMKSDCILKTISSYVDAIEPKEVVALLDILAQASSDERYTHILANDGSLFLNVGCLLQTITKIGKRPSGEDDNNIFTPVQKLGQLAPNSEENTNIERDISYSLKSMLIRVIGNLSYKNIKNQALAREMGIIMAVVDSTCLDARNPLIKEWSILAIRNLCENNAENQQIIRQLTKIGDADNSDILKELNMDMGSLRIGPN